MERRNIGKEILAGLNDIKAWQQGKRRLKATEINKADYTPFDPADYVDNPIALARINAGITQEELAKCMGVTQAYINKIESQDKVTAKLLKKVKEALE